MQKNSTVTKTFSRAQLEELVRELIPTIQHARVVALYGPLGAGKTTFVSACARALGVQEPVSSPTFAYVNRYTPASPNTFSKIYHFDLYRLHDINQFYESGFDELLEDPQALVFIEWPEKIETLLPSHTCHVHLAYDSGDMGKRIVNTHIGTQTTRSG